MDKQLSDALAKLASRLDALTSPWLTPEQAARYMHKGKGAVDEWIRSGKLESRRDPNSKHGTLIHRAWCDELIKSWDSAARTPESLRL